MDINVFGYENKENIQFMYQKNVVKKNMVIYYVLKKDFSTLMYNHALLHRKKQFYRYCLQAFSTEEILKHHIKVYFKINGKQKIITPIKSEYIKFNNFEKQKKKNHHLLFMQILKVY